MKNNELMEVKENFFTRIKKILYEKLNKVKNKVSSAPNKVSSLNDSKEKEEIQISKDEFMDLYNKIKKGEILINDISNENLGKMCQLMEEEIKLTQKQIDNLKKQLEN